MLDTLAGLKKYCEEPLYLTDPKKPEVVKMRDDSALNERLDEPLEY